MEIKFRCRGKNDMKIRGYEYLKNDMWISEREGITNPTAFPATLKREQYTGLKDKNGKEIYFGDILATSNSDIDYDIWTKEDNGYTVVEEDVYELGIQYSKWSMTYDVESIYHFRFCEVVGNIYENYYLIKE